MKQVGEQGRNKGEKQGRGSRHGKQRMDAREGYNGVKQGREARRGNKEGKQGS